MRKNMIRIAMALVAMALMLPAVAGAAAMEVKLTPKIDNFFILMDASGSMGQDYQDSGATRYANARAAVERMNGLIPELGYGGSLFALAPFTEYLPLAPYARGEFGAAIAKLPSDVSFWTGPATPLGFGLRKLENSLPPKSERTAVIIFSDGGSNVGVDPVPIARKIYEKYDGNLCFHVVGYAETRGNQRVLDAIEKLGGCSVSVSGAELENVDNLKDFVHKIFYDEEIVAIAAEPVAVVEEVVVVEETPAPAPEQPVVLEAMVNFDFDKSDIKAEYERTLEQVARFMEANPDAVATVSGYTDSVGPAEYNVGLSKRRALSVKNDLAKRLGVDASRIVVQAYGEDDPVASNSTAEGRSQNRRAEIVVATP